MQRAVKTLQHFEFRSDFTIVEPPEPVVEPAPENIALTSSDLALLLSEARTEGYAAAQAQFAAAQDARLEEATGRLSEALASLVELAGHLEASALEQGFSDKALRLITATAQRIADGQGDLFAERAEFSQYSPQSPATRPEDKT
ncbi:MAG: hypothetical protein R3C13_11415 [Hyphomonas sp.]|uniref:hypothetical protein n=1 Tax=Hyphomonas sp. TaxID=87 RepID=UPI00352728EA